MGLELPGTFLMSRAVSETDGAEMLISLLTRADEVGSFALFVSIVATVLAPVSDDWFMFNCCLVWP